jgi:hypothetical protein
MDLADWHMWWKRSGARELRRMLMAEWDPIGVREIPGAADEYDAYLGPIASRLRADATTEEIAAFLTDVEEVGMGLGASDTARRRNVALAARLRAWYAEATAAPES